MTLAHARLAQALHGRYGLIREIGEGGMATVYLAEDLRHDRKVAIKVLKPNVAAILGVERFLSDRTRTPTRRVAGRQVGRVHIQRDGRR